MNLLNNPYPSFQNPSDSSKYPTLPPIQNTQQPQNPHFPMQNGYIPPASYGHIQAGQPQEIDYERLLNENKLKELETSLENCWTTCHKIWLLLNMIWSVVSILRALPVAFKGNEGAEVILTWFMFYWFIFVKSLVGTMSVFQKSLGKASFVSCLVVISALFSLTVWGTTYQYLKGKPKYTELLFEGATLAKVNAILGVIFVVYAVLDIVCAVRLRRILMEREVVKVKLSDDEETLNKI